MKKEIETAITEMAKLVAKVVVAETVDCNVGLTLCKGIECLTTAYNTIEMIERTRP